MPLKNGKRRLRRLPLSLAVAGAMSVGAICLPAMAGETLANAMDEQSCSAYINECSYAELASTSVHSDRASIYGGLWSAGPGIGITYGAGTYPADTAVADDISILNGSANGAVGSPAIQIGQGSIAAGSMGIGHFTRVDAAGLNATAIGSNAAADRKDTVSFGSASLKRRITNVATGVNGTDLSNVDQLSPLVATLGGSIDGTTGAVTIPDFSAGGVSHPSLSAAIGALDGTITTANSTITNLTTQLSSGAVGLVQQSSAGASIAVGAHTDGSAVDFRNNASANRTLAGVAAGELSNASTDAVNGSQLYATHRLVAGNAGEITNIFAFLANLSNGSVGLVLQNAGTQNITVAANTGGQMVAMGGSASARTLTGLAAGDVTEGSRDLVNGAQLNAINQWIGGLDGRVTNIMGDIADIQRDIAGLVPGIADVITYDDATKSRATLGGADGTLVTNVGPALIAAGSMQMVNGGQLFDFNSLFESQLGDLGDRADDLERQWADVEKDIADGTLDPGHFDGDAGGDRITGVAPGIADTDGVNVGQLNELVDEAIKQAQNYTDQQAAAFSSNLDNYKKEVQQRFKRQDERIDRVGAMSAASTHMAINASGATTARGRLAVGAGVQNGKGAMAVGYGRPVGERAYFSAGGTVSGPERSAGVGLSVSF